MSWHFDPADLLAEDLAGVMDLAGVADGDTLVWDDGAGMFVPGTGGGGGGGTPPAVVDHGNLGSAETFDYVSGAQPAHEGTLDDDCTFTFDGVVDGFESIMTIGLLQDGTGGHAVTLPASVLNKADAEAAVLTGAGDYTVLPFRTVDGGTAWVCIVGPSLLAYGKGYIEHGSTASTARPTGFASIEWFGTVEPDNWIDGDTWNDPT